MADGEDCAEGLCARVADKHRKRYRDQMKSDGDQAEPCDKTRHESIPKKNSIKTSEPGVDNEQLCVMDPDTCRADLRAENVVDIGVEPARIDVAMAERQHRKDVAV